MFIQGWATYSNAMGNADSQFCGSDDAFQRLSYATNATLQNTSLGMGLFSVTAQGTFKSLRPSLVEGTVTVEEADDSAMADSSDSSALVVGSAFATPGPSRFCATPTVECGRCLDGFETAVRRMRQGQVELAFRVHLAAGSDLTIAAIPARFARKRPTGALQMKVTADCDLLSRAASDGRCATDFNWDAMRPSGGAGGCRLRRATQIGDTRLDLLSSGCSLRPEAALRDAAFLYRRVWHTGPFRTRVRISATSSVGWSHAGILITAGDAPASSSLGPSETEGRGRTWLFVGLRQPGAVLFRAVALGHAMVERVVPIPTHVDPWLEVERDATGRFSARWRPGPGGAWLEVLNDPLRLSHLLDLILWRFALHLRLLEEVMPRSGT